MTDRPRDIFLRPRLRGARFDGAAIPVPVLQELVELRALIVEVAQYLFKEQNRHRKRVPKGFADSFQLALSGVEPGSAIPVLTRPATEPLLFAVEGDYFGRALEWILETIDAANNDEFVTLPPPLARRFDRLGRHLAEGDSMEFHRADGPPTTYTQATRRQMARVGGRPEVTAERRLRGPVVGISENEPTPAFDVRVAPGREAAVQYAPDERDDVIDALSKKWGVRCVLDVTASLADDGSLRKVVAVHAWEFEDAVDEAQFDRISQRIDEFGALRDGWMEGRGRAPTQELLDFARNLIVAIVAEFESPRDVFLYPTPDGGVRAEWDLERAEFTVEVVEPRRVVVSSLRHDTGEDTWEELRGDEFTLADGVVGRLAEEVRPGGKP